VNGVPSHGRRFASATIHVVTEGSPVAVVEEAVEAAAPAEPTTHKAPVDADAEAFMAALAMDLRESNTRPPFPLAKDPVRARTLAALEDLRQIPALQSLAQEFVHKLGRPEVDVEEVVATIEKDSALCVRVLRLANSVLVSSAQRIEDLDTAVQMLGVRRVRQVAQALFTLRGASRVGDGFDWRHLWIHALATAAIAEELEEKLRSTDNSQVYLAALLHDVGKIVLSTISPDDYRELLVTAWNENGRLEDLERLRLGVDHREAGVIFARHNGLPDVVIATIANHDDPAQAESHRFEVALVALANYLSKAHGLGFSGARLDDSDGDFETHRAWEVIAAQLGAMPNIDAITEEMRGFIVSLRADLATIREGL
jgi:putative nucleotidyltransferase with HDIG domain